MKYILPVLIIVGVIIGIRLFGQLRDIGKPKQSAQTVAEKQEPKTADEKRGAPLETPDIGGSEKAKEEPKPLHLVAVSLSQVGADQLLVALGERIAAEGKIQVVPNATNDGVIISGDDKQHVVTYAELVRQYDRAAKLVTVNAVVGRLVKGRGLRVGLYDILKQSVVEAQAFPLTELLRNVNWNLVTGVASFGTAYEARLAISLITDFESSQYGFEVVSRPSVTIVSGQSGVFASGREIPVPVTTQNVSGSQTSIQYKQAEFRFSVMPTVRPDGTIRLRVDQQNSDVLSSSEIGGDAVPVLSTQTLKTMMDLQPSQVAFLGGIRVRNDRDDRRGVPVLGDVPVLNLVFGSRDKGREESELVILLSVDVHSKGETPVQIRKAVPVGGNAWLSDTATLSRTAAGKNQTKQAVKNQTKKATRQ